MYLLDTDTLSNALRGHHRITQRILMTPQETLFVSTVTVQEMFAGSFDTLNKLYSKKRVYSTFTECSAGIIRLAQFLNTLNIVPYQDEDEAHFVSLAPA